MGFLARGHRVSLDRKRRQQRGRGGKLTSGKKEKKEPGCVDTNSGKKDCWTKTKGRDPMVQAHEGGKGGKGGGKAS